MVVSPPESDYHAFVSYCPLFQIPAILHVFVPQLLKLSRVANFGMFFLMMWFICLSDKNEFMLIIVAAIFRIGLSSFVNFCSCSIVPGITGLHCVRTVKTPTPSSER